MRYLSRWQTHRASEIAEDRISVCTTCGERQFLENAIIDYADGSATISACCMGDHGRTMISLSPSDMKYIGRTDSSNLLEEKGVSETGRENANLYMRGVKEAVGGRELDPWEIMELLDLFGEDGVRAYMTGYCEGLEENEDPENVDAEEDGT